MRRRAAPHEGSPGVYPAVIVLSVATRAHFSTSLSRKACTCSGDPPATSVPSAISLSRTSGDFNVLLTAAASELRTAGGSDVACYTDRFGGQYEMQSIV